MASALTRETEDLTTCGVCLCEYDDDTRRPKFLSCAHTLCLSCLKKIWKNNQIICPLCRQNIPVSSDVNTLPNNPFALHILKLQSKILVESSAQANFPKCCQTCQLIAKPSCISSHHSCFGMKASSWISLRADLHKKLDQSHNELANGIQQRREVQEYLSQVSQALNLFLSDVKKEEEENNLHLAELISLLEESVYQRESRMLESLFSELTGQDSVAILKEKLNSKYCELYQDKLTASATQSVIVGKQKMVKTIAQQFDEANNPIPCWKLLEEGFTVRWDQAMTPTKRNLILISYITFAANERIQRRRKGNLLPLTLPNSSASSDNLVHSSTANTATSSASRLPYASASSNPASLEALPSPNIAKFVMQIFKSENPIGQLNISPVISSPCYEFINLLSNYCSSTNLVYDNYRFKAVPDTYVLLDQFEDLSFISASSIVAVSKSYPYDNALAIQVGDVGVVQVSTDAFSLIFPLEKFQEKRTVSHNHVKNLPRAFLLGRITNPSGVERIAEMSRTKNSERDDIDFELSYE